MTSFDRVSDRSAEPSQPSLSWAIAEDIHLGTPASLFDGLTNAAVGARHLASNPSKNADAKHERQGRRASRTKTPTIASVATLSASHEKSELGPKQPDLFVIDDVAGDWSIKDDMASMEFPMFSLSKNPCLKIRTYSRGNKTLRIIPSHIGAPTIFDKDLLIFIISQISRALNDGRPASRRVRFDVHPFLSATHRSTGGAAYERVLDMLRRLRGSTIETNIKTTEDERTCGFGFIEHYRVLQRTRNDKGALQLEVTTSEWLYRAALEFDVLSISPAYFSLAALERRVYELARKHCGNQPWWTVGLPLLQEKTGSTNSARRFRFDIKALVDANALPEYRLGLDDSVMPSQLVVLTRDDQRLLSQATKSNKLDWVVQFLQKAIPAA